MSFHRSLHHRSGRTNCRGFATMDWPVGNHMGFQRRDKNFMMSRHRKTTNLYIMTFWGLKFSKLKQKSRPFLFIKLRLDFDVFGISRHHEVSGSLLERERMTYCDFIASTIARYLQKEGRSEHFSILDFVLKWPFENDIVKIIITNYIDNILNSRIFERIRAATVIPKTESENNLHSWNKPCSTPTFEWWI